jgi:hypothetical protein
MEGRPLSESMHPAAPHHLPVFFTAPDETDVLMAGVGIFLVLAVLGVGILFLRLHTLPERIAHKGHKLQFEIVAVLGLLALFTHIHLFWVAGLLLALIDLPDFGSPLGRMAGALEKIAGLPPGQGLQAEGGDHHPSGEPGADRTLASLAPPDGVHEPTAQPRVPAGKTRELTDA